jgi:thiamine-phosphate pyrophosphorylase
MAARISGLYAVTPDTADTAALVALVRAALDGGCRWVQYRNKVADVELRREQAWALRRVTAQSGVALIVNDDPALALAAGADGVHVGGEDAPVEEARRLLGAGAIIGASCYDRLDLALAAQAAGADYVAFGSFFPSTVKPGAVRPEPGLLTRARERVNLPRVAIGGITPENAPLLITAGADALAVVSALFGVPDVAGAARRFCALFNVSTQASEP